MASVRHLGLFPFCILKKQDVINTIEESGSPLSYQDLLNVYETITANLSTNMALYWRVKSWRCTGEWQLDLLRGEGVETRSYDIVLTRNAETEKHLVCLEDTFEDGTLFVKGFTGTPLSLETPDGGGTAFWGPYINVPSYNSAGLRFGPRAVIDQENETYSTGIDVGFNLLDGPDPDADFYAASSIALSPLSENVNGTIPLSLLGQTYSIPANVGSSQGALSCSLSVVATEYWPYDPEDGGGPIYNSVTGAQLRPFPA